jgi:lactate dehydrogenase-like 2-hydroxyacid dehydrogenase
MSKPRVFVTRRVPEEAVEVMRVEAEVEVWPGEEPPPGEVLRGKVSEVEGLYTNIMDRVDDSVLGAGKSLKVVSQMAAGLDNIDVGAATRRGIPVGYTPGIVAAATADQTFALLLASARRISESERWVRGGNWRIAFHPMYWLGWEVHGATIGIVGMGKIGMEVAKRARGFDMRVLYCSRRRNEEAEKVYGAERREMASLLGESDFVSLHVPLTPETRGLVGEEELRRMKKTSILVNAARGPVVDAKALYRALKEGWIAGAALDVTDPEPIPAGDALLTLENCVVAPHLGSATVGTRTRMAVAASKNLLAGLKGEKLPLCANPEVYK